MRKIAVEFECKAPPLTPSPLSEGSKYGSSVPMVSQCQNYLEIALSFKTEKENNCTTSLVGAAKK